MLTFRPSTVPSAPSTRLGLPHTCMLVAPQGRGSSGSGGRCYFAPTVFCRVNAACLL